MGRRHSSSTRGRREAAGFLFALISDHFHPWLDRQGESPFVWTTLGGIARATESLTIGTGVTCPTMRIHPAIDEREILAAAPARQGVRR